MTFDLKSWKTICIFLSSWWSVVPSCMILDLMVHSVFAYNIFLLCDNTPLISFSHHADQMQEVVRSWSLWFGLKSRTDRRTTLYHKTSPKRLAYKNIFFTNISDPMLCSACSIQEKIKQKIQWFIQLWNGIFTLA